MALENLFIRTKNSIAGVNIDGIISEDHDRQWRTTDHPVELGANITDHTIIEPKKLTIVGEITDTPLGGAAFGAIIDTVGRFGTSTENGGTRSQQGYQQLIAVANARDVISVQTKLQLYDSMIISSIRTLQDKDSSKIVRFQMDLKEIFVVETEVVDIPPEQLAAGKTRQQASSPAVKGKVEQQTVDPESAKGKTALKSAIDWIF